MSAAEDSFRVLISKIAKTDNCPVPQCEAEWTLAEDSGEPRCEAGHEWRADMVPALSAEQDADSIDDQIRIEDEQKRRDRELGLSLDDGPECEGADTLAERFAPSATLIEAFLNEPPPPREWVVDRMIPERRVGALVAKGGTGKGHVENALAIAVALGGAFGPFNVSRPRGVILVSLEDDRAEMHRRFAAAFDASAGEDAWSPSLRRDIVDRVRVVDLVGVPRAVLGDELRGHIARLAATLEDPGLVIIDPMGKAIPPGRGLNDQADAGVIVKEFDAIANQTGCACLFAHHVSKFAIRANGELSAGASTGSLQFEDFSRFVVAMKSLDSEEAKGYGLEEKAGRYVELTLTKTNYSPQLTEPVVFERVEGGALRHVPARMRSEVADEEVLVALASAGTWLTRSEWEDRCKDRGIGVRRAKGARTRLVDSSRVERRRNTQSKSDKRDYFAPHPDTRASSFPVEPGQEVAA